MASILSFREIHCFRDKEENLGRQPGGFLNDPGGQSAGVFPMKCLVSFLEAFVSETLVGLVLLILPVKDQGPG